jgi:hypothetical protein
LKAEFPHFWTNIERFIKGKTEYSESAIKHLIGKDSEKVIADLQSIGFLEETIRKGKRYYKIPFLFRDGLELSQGRVES